MAYMQKYPLSSMRQTLIEWKYQKKYAHELKSYDLHEKITGELEVLLRNKLKIVNDGGSLEVVAEPMKFFTTTLLMNSFDEEIENERLKNALADFDNSVYIKASESESNTFHQSSFFKR
jgi:hypothetical protein